jgi:hypothetical protein
MIILSFLAENWDSVLVLLVAFAAAVYLIVKKRRDLLGVVLFGLVTWAEREYGGGTGTLKLALVIEKVYPHIPTIIRAFVSTAKLEQMIDNALQAAKLKWDKNPKLIQPTASTVK